MREENLFQLATEELNSRERKTELWARACALATDDVEYKAISEELDFEEFVILSLLEGDSDDFDLMPPNCWTVDADFNYESTVPPCLLAERRRRRLMIKMGMP